MRDQVLWRKIGRIVDMVAHRLNISITQALDLFYNSHTYALLVNPDSGIMLQSDLYILNDFLKECESKKLD